MSELQKSNFWAKFLALLCSLSICMGCHVGPKYSPPETEVPLAFKGDVYEAPRSGERPCEAWWEIFNDPVLNSLEEQVLDYNPTLEQAIARISQEYALWKAAEADNYPHINFSPFVQVQESLIVPFGGAASTGTTTTTPTPTPSIGASTVPLTRVRFENITLPLLASYEVDLWGKRADNISAALSRAQASVEGYRNVWLKLTTDLASNYFQLRGLQSEKEILTATRDARKQELDLNGSRYSSGIANESDVKLAELEFSNAIFDLTDVDRRILLLQDIIAVLAGQFPSTFDLEALALNAPPPMVEHGLPSDLLLRRPDIGEAERNMAATLADASATYADLFPTLDLTGGIGYSSPKIADLFEWRARLWQWAINSTQTIFDAGQKCDRYEAARAVYLQSVFNYEQTVLSAFQEVEDALANIKMFKDQYIAATNSEKAAKDALEIYQTRYRQGLNNYLDVVQNERTYLTTQLTRATVLIDQYMNTVFLIKAIGGGWDCCEE